MVGQQLQFRQGRSMPTLLEGAENAFRDTHCPGAFLRRTPGGHASIAYQNTQFLGAQSDLRRSIHPGSRRINVYEDIEAAV